MLLRSTLFTCTPDLYRTTKQIIIIIVRMGGAFCGLLCQRTSAVSNMVHVVSSICRRPRSPMLAADGVLRLLLLLLLPCSFETSCHIHTRIIIENTHRIVCVGLRERQRGDGQDKDLVCLCTLHNADRGQVVHSVPVVWIKKLEKLDFND